MRSLLDLIVPPACAACGRFGSVLCEGCQGAFASASDETRRFLAPEASVVVGSDLTLALAAFAFEGPVRKALSRLKYGGAARVAGPLAELAHPMLGRLTELSGPAVLVPVPIHPARQRQRGYNQAELLARHLARTSGQQVADLLARSTITERQHRLDRAARTRNLRGAIGLRSGPPAPSVAIVVDDILTTAATLEACASVLVAGGVGEVYGFAIAREV